MKCGGEEKLKRIVFLGKNMYVFRQNKANWKMMNYTNDFFFVVVGWLPGEYLSHGIYQSV